VPAIDYQAAFDAQTFCYISNFAQVIGNMLPRAGERPADLIEPSIIRSGKHGRHNSLPAAAQ